MDECAYPRVCAKAASLIQKEFSLALNFHNTATHD
jgi:hypothetical protein